MEKHEVSGVKFLKDVSSSKWGSSKNNKGKGNICQGYEQKFSTEIFQVVKVTQRIPQPLYELSDLQARPIEGKF